jgi:hypothetical protein
LYCLNFQLLVQVKHSLISELDLSCNYRLPRLLVILEGADSKGSYTILFKELESLFDVTYRTQSDSTQKKKGERDALGKISNILK